MAAAAVGCSICTIPQVMREGGSVSFVDAEVKKYRDMKRSVTVEDAKKEAAVEKANILTRFSSRFDAATGRY